MFILGSPGEAGLERSEKMEMKERPQWNRKERHTCNVNGGNLASNSQERSSYIWFDGCLQKVAQ